MSKSTTNRRKRLRRAKKNQKISLTAAIATIFEHFQRVTPEDSTNVFVAQRNQKLRFAADPSTVEQISEQHMIVFTKIIQKRLDVLLINVSTRVEQYLELERLIPVTPGHQGILLRQQMEQSILPALCKDWWEYLEMFKQASGGSNIPHTQSLWLNNHCATIAGRPIIIN